MGDFQGRTVNLPEGTSYNLTKKSWGLSTNDRDSRLKLLPIGSMYAIYGNIYHQYTPNVGIYTIHGSYGLANNGFLFLDKCILYHVCKIWWQPDSQEKSICTSWDLTEPRPRIQNIAKQWTGCSHPVWTQESHHIRIRCPAKVSQQQSGLNGQTWIKWK